MLQDLLMQALSGGAVNQISKQIGADESATGNAIQAALPFIIGALARNASNPQGADSLNNALTKDHDGSILDNIGGFLGNTQSVNGAGILGHIFDQKQEAVANQISQESGLNIGQVAQLLITIAPIIMGLLGRTQRQEGLDSQGLSGYLQGQQQQEVESSPMGGLVSSLLDQDHDGSVVDDIAGLAAKFFAR
jgi:hypothetical protein